MKFIFPFIAISLLLLNPTLAAKINCYLPNGTLTKKQAVALEKASEDIRKNACNTQVQECQLRGGCTSIPPKK